MKKLLSSILMLSLLLMSACQDNLTQEPVNTKDNDHPVFHVTIADEGTRTQLNSSLQMEWVAGDRICIKCGEDAAIYQADASGASADFSYVSGATLPSSGTFEAYYPASLAEEAVLPAEQTYVANNIAGLPMRASSSDLNLNFKHLCGILELVLSTEDTGIEVNGIVLESAEGMSGAFTLNGDAARLGSTTGDLSMTIDTPVALGTEATSIYLAVPEGTYASGARFIVKTNLGWRVFTSNKALTFSRAHVTPTILTVAAARISKARATSDAKVTWSYFDAPAGAISALPAAGTKENCTVELLADYTISSQLRIGGKAFTWNGNGHTVTFTGNYPEITNNYQGGLHVCDGSDVDFINTKFQGPGADNATRDRGFAVYNAKASFGKDVVISDFRNTRPYGAAIWVNLNSTIKLVDNATITDCHNVPASSNYGGGAICCDGIVIMQDDALISNCSSAFWGGAILSNYQDIHSGKVQLSISGRACIRDCKSGKAGGAFYCNGKTELSGDVVLSGCYAATSGGAIECRKVITISDNVLIKDCSATSGGGAIFVNSSSSKLTMSNNVRITDCHALGESGGAIRSSYIAVYVTLKDNVRIDNCTAKVDGGAVHVSGYFTMSDNVTIDSCSAEQGGALFIWRDGVMNGNAKIMRCSAKLGGAVIDTTATDNTDFPGFKIKGNASITDCNAQFGGALYLANNVAVKCEVSESATISGNTATQRGSIIYCQNVANINGGTLSTSSTNEAIYVQTGTVTVTGGNVGNFGSGNIFAAGSGAYNVKGGNFNKNNFTPYSGYTFTDNPADTENYKYKVVAQ